MHHAVFPLLSVLSTLIAAPDVHTLASPDGNVVARLRLTLRAYNEGLALAYTVPRQPGYKRVRIARENTQFRFTADHAAWAVYSAQGRYDEVRLSRVKPGCERPLVLRVDDETYVAVAEARLVDYARMKLAPLAGTDDTLTSQLGSEVEAELPLVTPWRVVMVAPSPGELLENNDILLNLNDPCAIDDVSWIKPGKVIREVTLTSDGGKACLDFAAEHNLQYVEFDASWYGHEYSEESDATTVRVDPKRSPGPLDLDEVTRYANERGVGNLLRGKSKNPGLFCGRNLSCSKYFCEWSRSRCFLPRDSRDLMVVFLQ
jgi:alpha-glucosidase